MHETKTLFMKKSFTLLLLLSLFTWGCSNSDDPKEDAEKNLISQITNGYFYEEEGCAFQFNSDKTIEWMECGHLDDGQWCVTQVGNWNFDDGQNIIIKWPEDQTLKGKSNHAYQKPEILFNVAFANEKLSFSDQTGTNFVLKNAQPYTFIKEKIYGNEFEYTTSYEYGLINYTIIHNLKFSQDGLTAEWNVKKLNTAVGKVLESYSGTGYVYTNIAQDEIYFYTWFFDDGIYSNEDMLLPPRYLVDIDLKETSSGKTTISANSGHYSWDKISFIQK